MTMALGAPESDPIVVTHVATVPTRAARLSPPAEP